MWTLLSGNISFVLGVVAWAIGGAIFLWLIALLPYRRLSRVAFESNEICEELVLLFFGCLLGLTVGMLTGFSRQSAVGAVVPAVLTLIGALVGYLFSGTVAATVLARFTILLASVALVIFFFLGTVVGAQLRAPWDQQAQTFELYKLEYASELEHLRMKYEAELQRVSRIHQAELDVYKATQLKSRSATSPPHSR